jgi:hypothetical protein
VGEVKEAKVYKGTTGRKEKHPNQSHEGKLVEISMESCCLSLIFPLQSRGKAELRKFSFEFKIK